jgi:hypothetical protein
MTDISSVIREIKTLEKEQEQAKLDHSKLLGQRESEVDRLKKEFNLTTLAQADKELDKLQKRLAKIDEQIILKYTNLKDRYDTNA